MPYIVAKRQTGFVASASEKTLPLLLITQSVLLSIKCWSSPPVCCETSKKQGCMYIQCFSLHTANVYSCLNLVLD